MRPTRSTTLFSRLAGRPDRSTALARAPEGASSTGDTGAAHEGDTNHRIDPRLLSLSAIGLGLLAASALAAWAVLPRPVATPVPAAGPRPVSLATAPARTDEGGANPTLAPPSPATAGSLPDKPAKPAVISSETEPPPIAKSGNARRTTAPDPATAQCTVTRVDEVRTTLTKCLHAFNQRSRP